MKLATSSICKNELKYVDLWYNALKDEVDYITVLDTGSTDGTYERLLEISKEDPKLIVDQMIIDPWRFDTARNQAMTLIPNDTDVWISIDFDERFEPGFGTAIRDNWKPGYTLQATYRYTWNHHEDGSPNHEFTYSKIVANDGKWVWEYPIHECLKRTEDVEYEESQVVDLTEIVHLHHYQDRNIDRSYYLDLLRKRYAENGEDIDVFYLARELMFHGQYEESISVFERLNSNPDSDLETIERAYCFFMTGCCFYHLDREMLARDYFYSAIHTDPTYRDPYIELAKLLIGNEGYAQAEFWLKECLKKTYRHMDWTEVNDVWTSVPYDLLSVACFNLGHKKEALMYCARAIALGPTEQLQKNFEFINNSISDVDMI